MKIWLSLQVSLKFVWINNIATLVPIMAWRWPGDKPLSGPIIVTLWTHICITRPKWVRGDAMDVGFPRGGKLFGHWLFKIPGLSVHVFWRVQCAHHVIFQGQILEGPSKNQIQISHLGGLMDPQLKFTRLIWFSEPVLLKMRSWFLLFFFTIYLVSFLKYIFSFWSLIAWALQLKCTAINLYASYTWKVKIGSDNNGLVPLGFGFITVRGLTELVPLDNKQLTDTIVTQIYKII